MKMKKLVAVTLMAAVAVSSMFAAKAKKEKKAKKSKTAATKLITVGYAQVGAESDWRLSKTHSLKQTDTN